MQIDVENLQVELHVKRRRITKLERELQHQHEEEVNAAVLDAIYRFWHLTCRKGNRNVKFGKKRRAALVERLREGYSPLQVAEAILGAARDAFEKNGERYDDLELICRDELHLERFLKRRRNREEYEALRREAGLPYEHNETPDDAEIDRQLEADRIYVWLRGQPGLAT